MRYTKILKDILDKLCAIESNGGFSTVVDNGDGTYTHTSGSGAVTVISASGGAGGAVQNLSLSGTLLGISGGNTLDLSSLISNGSDDQAISIDYGTNIVTLENGGTIDLTPYLSGTNPQLSIAGNVLSISGGNSVVIPTGGAGAAQQLGLQGNVITISGGNSIDLTAILGAGTAAGTSVANVPTYYTALTQDVEAHLIGIDNFLATIAGGGGETYTESGSTLIGAQDGVNSVFTVPQGSYLEDIEIFINGQKFTDNSGVFYTNPATGVITFENPPAPLDLIDINYRTSLPNSLPTINGVNSVVGGTNITIDNTDPLNPIINASGGTSLTLDTQPISASANGITSGAVYDALVAIGSYAAANSISGSRIVNNSISGSAKLVDGSVNEDKLAILNTPLTGQVLSWNGTGMIWTAAAGGGTSDDLGNHTATQILDLNRNAIANVALLDFVDALSNPTIRLSQIASGTRLVNRNATPDHYIEIRNDGVLQTSTLSGVGTEMVVADAAGNLSRQAIPAGGGTDTNDFITGSNLSGTTLNLTGTGAAGTSIDLEPLLESGSGATNITVTDGGVLTLAATDTVSWSRTGKIVHFSIVSPITVAALPIGVSSPGTIIIAGMPYPSLNEQVINYSFDGYYGGLAINHFKTEISGSGLELRFGFHNLSGATYPSASLPQQILISGSYRAIV